MEAYVARFISIASVCSLFVACGPSAPSDLKLRQALASQFDAFKATQVDLTFSLPDRTSMVAERSDIRELMDGYYVFLEGSGEQCPEGERIEDAGPFEDGKVFHFPVSSACTYAVTLRLGHRGEAASTVQTERNWNQDIEPLLQAHCSSCPSDALTYNGFVARAEQLILEIENGTLTPDFPFTDADIATILAWQAEGYLEAGSTAAATPAEQSLAAVYYRNNDNDVVESYELLGRTFIQLARSLWLQADGTSEGLTTKQLLTFRAQAPAGK